MDKLVAIGCEESVPEYERAQKNTVGLKRDITMQAKTERDKELHERQIKIVDTHFDKLIYELYWLTEMR